MTLGKNLEKEEEEGGEGTKEGEGVEKDDGKIGGAEGTYDVTSRSIKLFLSL